MKASNRPSSSVAALASLTAAFAISSCALPPREAWHQIQQEGLIAFISNQSHTPAAAAPSSPAPTPAGIAIAPAKTAIAANSQQLVGPPRPAPSVAAAPTVPLNIHNIMPATDKAQVATSVPSLPGFVRSPYTVPPRLVDVKGATPGATMVCPYTQRAFIIPSDFVNPPSGALASNPAPASSPIAQPPTIALKNNTPSTPAPATNPPANALFNNKPANSTAAAKPAAPEIPYGMPIPNRPGFVNSPFAAKHQLVDVTGLPVGMEVKCPYTGKLFKVPAQDIAEQKAVAAPGAPPAPEKAEKK